MIELSLVYPYYNNRANLDRQMELWAHLPRELARRVEYVLVDDGSPQPAAVPPSCPLNLTLVRINEDIPWNQPGARNLGLKLAEGEWAIASDIDHIFPIDGLSQVLSMVKDPDSVFYFGRRREDGSEKHPHPNSFLILRKTFWSVGGYDEDFCGHYGKDDLFLRKTFERACQIVELKAPALIELNDAATPGMLRKTRRNRRLYKRKLRRLEKGRYQNGRTIRFEWEIVNRWRLCP